MSHLNVEWGQESRRVLDSGVSEESSVSVEFAILAEWLKSKAHDDDLRISFSKICFAPASQLLVSHKTRHLSLGYLFELRESEKTDEEEELVGDGK